MKKLMIPALLILTLALGLFAGRLTAPVPEPAPAPIQTTVPSTTTPLIQAPSTEADSTDFSPSQALATGNPIDDYFMDWGAGTVTGSEVLICAHAEAEAWKTEMLHFFDLLLAYAHPTISDPADQIAKSRDALLAYAESAGQVEAYVWFTDAFGDETDQYGETIGAGNGYPYAFYPRQAEIFRSQALHLYGLLDAIGITPDLIFDPADYEDLR